MTNKDAREKWAERLQTMKENRANDTDRQTITDAEIYLIDQMIANTAEMIRDFSPIDLHKENLELKQQLEELKKPVFLQNKETAEESYEQWVNSLPHSQDGHCGSFIAGFNAKGNLAQEMEAETEVMIQAFDKIRTIFSMRAWIIEGRGPYIDSDDEYRKEVTYLYEEFDALVNDVWKNIKSRSVDFRNKIINDYLSDKKALLAFSKDQMLDCHMAGQTNAGCSHSSWSEATAYVAGITPKSISPLLSELHRWVCQETPVGDKTANKILEKIVELQKAK